MSGGQKSPERRQPKPAQGKLESTGRHQRKDRNAEMSDKLEKPGG